MAKKKRPHTEIVSEKQRRAMAATRSAQEGKTPPGELYGAAREMYETMKKTGPKSPKAHLKEAAGKKLPLYVKKKKLYRKVKGK